MPQYFEKKVLKLLSFTILTQSTIIRKIKERFEK